MLILGVSPQPEMCDQKHLKTHFRLFLLIRSSFRNVSNRQIVPPFGQVQGCRPIVFVELKFILICWLEMNTQKGEPFSQDIARWKSRTILENSVLRSVFSFHVAWLINGCCYHQPLKTMSWYKACIHCLQETKDLTEIICLHLSPVRSFISIYLWCISPKVQNSQNILASAVPS